MGYDTTQFRRSGTGDNKKVGGMMSFQHQAEIIPFRTLLKKQLTAKSGIRYSSQMSLFPYFDERLVLLVNIESISGEQLLGLIADTKPSVVFDLRPCPRFDLEGIDRPTFLKIIKEKQARYFDLANANGILTSDDPKLHPVYAAALVSDKLASLKLTGPILVFLNSSQQVTDYSISFPGSLKPIPKNGWDVHPFESWASE
ncbi:MAG: hypothetical protein H7839_03890 [Magnetococcus sp. YQC-5]